MVIPCSVKRVGRSRSCWRVSRQRASSGGGAAGRCWRWAALFRDATCRTAARAADAAVAAAGGGAGEGAGPLGGDRPAADYALPAGGAAAGDGRVRLEIMALTLLLGAPTLGFLAAPGVG